MVICINLKGTGFIAILWTTLVVQRMGIPPTIGECMIIPLLNLLTKRAQRMI